MSEAATYDTFVAYGALEGGVWLNMMLLSWEINQAYRYLTTYKQDPVWTRLLVVGVVLADLAGSLAGCGLVFLSTVTYARASYQSVFTLLSWPLPTLVIATGLSGLALHVVLITRVWKLTKKWWLCGLHIIISLLAFAGCFASMMVVILANVDDPYSSLQKLDISLNIWLATSAGSDLTIAASLVTLLWMAKRSVSSLNTQSHVNRPLAILIRSAMESGGIPATLTILSLALYHGKSSVNVATGVMMTVGRVYSLTLLYTLLLRKRAARASYSGTGARMHSTAFGETMQSRTGAGSRAVNPVDTRRWSPASDSLSIIVHPPLPGEAAARDDEGDVFGSYRLAHPIPNEQFYPATEYFPTAEAFTLQSPELEQQKNIHFEQPRYD